MKSFEPSVFTITNSAAALMKDYVPVREQIFKEQRDIKPRSFAGNGKKQYLPWGHDDRIPYDVLDKIEDDEVLSTCQQHNIKNCYGGGVSYRTDNAGADIKEAVRKFLLHNSMASYFLGVCTDMKYWGFAVTVITLSRDGKKITNISRREAIYCRLAPYIDGYSHKVYYGDFRDQTPNIKDVEEITLLNGDDPFADLEYKLGISDLAKASKVRPTSERKFAIMSRVPTVDSTYYPIPYYASLFKGKWYDIKQLIAISKYSKLKNAAPIKYIVEFNEGFWPKYFDAVGATSDEERNEAMKKYKQEVIDFLTGAENAGKTIFSGFYVNPGTGKEESDVHIDVLDQKKEGGDWETDIQEAINMVCFTMGVHSNLVGSVPGKSQSNNSGSDKRELYTIAQELEKPTRDILMIPHQIVCEFNGWAGVVPECSIIQLTTLDEHKDVQETTANNNNNKEED